jgi:iron(III) transport system permease protein
MLKQRIGLWSVITLGLALLFLSPTLIIFGELLKPVSDNWDHVARHVLPVYVKNSFILIIGVVIITSIIGISSAWLVTQFEFVGKKWIEWLLMMPLAIPTYIMAYSYSGIFSFLETQHIVAIDIKNIVGLIFILSFALYPYVFAVCRVSFAVQNASVLEASRTMGKSYWLTFYKVALPLSRTAIIGGISLVVMELLNDYGAVKYYGVETITTGIFRTWFSMGDLNTAIRICAIALLIIIMFLAAERIQRGRNTLAEAGNQSRKILRRKLKGIKSVLALFGCLIPVLLGFIFPLTKIIHWVSLNITTTLHTDFVSSLFNTIFLGGCAAVLCILAGIIFNFAKNWESSWMVRILTRLSTTGYSIPGAVIAIGILVPALVIDKYFSAKTGSNFSLLNYTVFFLLFAYLIRFIAISNNALEANFKKISPQLTAASRMMGKSSFTTLLKVHLPLVKPGLLSAFLLVFVEVIKELPLTLILRPFDYNTLATRCFELASDERIVESSNYALLIIITGLVPVFFLHRLSKTKHL